MRSVFTISRGLCGVLAIAASLSLMAESVGAAEWKVEVVDPAGVGRFTSMKIDQDGNVHLAYVRDSDRSLAYAYWDHQVSRWFTMPVAQNASFCTLALDSKQKPHISFADAGMGKAAKLRHVYWDGAAWNSQPVSPANDSVVGYYTSIGLDAGDNASFSYYDYLGPGGADNTLRLRSVMWNGSYWAVHLVDRTRGSGKFNSLAVDSTGHPVIAYANVSWESSGLRFARWDGSKWKIEVVEGVGLSGGGEPTPIYSVSLVLDKDDNPHIAYTVVGKRQVKYAVKRNGNWQTSIVGTVQAVAYPDRNGIAVDAKGNPYISFYDSGSGALHVASMRAGRWAIETLEENTTGFTSSIQVDGGAIWVAYPDEGTGSLKVARRVLEEASPAVPSESSVAKAAGK